MKTLLLYGLLCCTLFVNSQTLTTSLVACYAFSGNANDAMSSLNGTLSAVTPTVDRLNNPNSAYSFNGSNSSFIVLPNDPLLKPTNAISFTCWFKANLFASGQYLVVTKNNATTNYIESYCIAINYSGGQHYLRVIKGDGIGVGNATHFYGTTPLQTNTWYHAAITIDNSAVKLYLNGALEGSSVTTIAFNYMAGRNVYLGGSNDPPYQFPFNGTIDNARFYTRVLSATEINQIYTQDPGCLNLASSPTASFSVSSATLCSGKTLTLTDLSINNPSSWNWQIPNANPSTSSVQNPTVVFQSSGVHTISLVSSNNSGNSAVFTQTVLVKQSPFVNALASANTICSGETCTMIVSGANTYTWSTGSNAVQTVVSPTVTTMYTVAGSNTLGCSSTGTILITVVPGLTLMVASSNSILCGGQMATLTASGAQNYNWGTSTGPTLTISPAVTTAYTVTGSSMGCNGSAVFTQSVLAPVITLTSSSATVCSGRSVSLTAAGALSYTWHTNSSGPPITGTQLIVSPISTTTYSVTGINSSGCSGIAQFTQLVQLCTSIDLNSETNLVRFFPNPTHGDFFIETKAQGLSEITVCNSIGEIVEQVQLNSELAQIDMANYAAGIYVIIYKSNSTLLTYKFLKE